LTATHAGDSGADVLRSWLRESVHRIRATGWRGIVLTGLGAAIGVVIALLQPPRFTSSASFVAQGASASALPSALLGIAASVGLGTTRDYSPQFYADLIGSDPVIKSALAREYPLSTDAGVVPRTYAEIEGFTGKQPDLALDGAMRHFRRRIATRADVRTNIVYVSVTARSPGLSSALTQALLDALDSINIGFRQEQSRELREFFEGRVANAQRELDSAETELRRFLERNRVVTNSPLLMFEQNRLTRASELKRALYTTVLQQYEETKMQESRNVPVLTVLSPPTPPLRKSGPARRLTVLAAAMLGLLAALVLDAARRLRQ
jgi:uncharacterized protein involved in exopolysaccharide biosynthesis